jgi:hypothetical protein
MSPETQTSSVFQTAWTPDQLPTAFRLARSRIMYVESKAAGLGGDARIGSVYFSKSGTTRYYRGLQFRSLKGSGFKSNYSELDHGGESMFWINQLRLASAKPRVAQPHS